MKYINIQYSLFILNIKTLHTYIKQEVLSNTDLSQEFCQDELNAPSLKSLPMSAQALNSS